MPGKSGFSHTNSMVMKKASYFEIRKTIFTLKLNFISNVNLKKTFEGLRICELLTPLLFSACLQEKDFFFFFSVKSRLFTDHFSASYSL